jgi:hypothetical protein
VEGLRLFRGEGAPLDLRREFCDKKSALPAIFYTLLSSLSLRGVKRF